MGRPRALILLADDEVESLYITHITLAILSKGFTPSPYQIPILSTSPTAPVHISQEIFDPHLRQTGFDHPPELGHTRRDLQCIPPFQFETAILDRSKRIRF
jgi:hypothetical protein